LLKNGKYFAWFRTSLGEGTGVVMLQDGKLTGDDTVIAYTGSYSQTGDEFTADITIHRHSGQLSVFGFDNVDLTLVGKSTRTMASCRGTSLQATGMTIEAIIIPIRGLTYTQHSPSPRGNPSRSYSALARALLAGRREYFATGLDRLLDRWKSGAVTRGAFDFCHSLFWFRSFHKTRSHLK
jgi:hypothetical protein